MLLEQHCICSLASSRYPLLLVNKSDLTVLGDRTRGIGKSHSVASRLRRQTAFSLSKIAIIVIKIQVLPPHYLILMVELTLLILGRGALSTFSRSRFKYQWYCRALSSTSGPNADDTGAWKRAQPKISIFYDRHCQNLFSDNISFLLHMWSPANPIQTDKPIIKSELRIHVDKVPRFWVWNP